MDKIVGRRGFIKLGALFAASLLLPKRLFDIEVPEEVAEQVIKPSLTDGKWHHIAYNSNNQFYFDGKEVDGIQGVRVVSHEPLIVGENDLAIFDINDLPEEFTISCWVQQPYVAKIELTSGDQLLYAAGMDPAFGLLDSIDEPGSKSMSWGYNVES